MRESALERKLGLAVKAIAGESVKWTSPSNAGVPDRIVLLPNGRVAFVEMKAPGKKMQPLQAWWAKKLTGMGHRHYVIDSEEGIQQFIDEVSG